MASMNALAYLCRGIEESLTTSMPGPGVRLAGKPPPEQEKHLLRDGQRRRTYQRLRLGLWRSSRQHIYLYHRDHIMHIEGER